MVDNIDIDSLSSNRRLASQPLVDEVGDDEKDSCNSVASGPES